MINRKKRPLKSAFTLIEMLVVMALMALMIGVGVSSFYGIGGGSALNGAVNEIQGALALARQQTVMQNSSVNIYFYEDNQSYDVVYQMWAMTNGVTVSYQQMKDEIADALRDGRNNKYGYKLGSLFHFPKGLKVSVDGTEIKGNINKYISLRPTGSTASAGTSRIEMILEEKGYGYEITVFPVTGLTSVKDIK